MGATRQRVLIAAMMLVISSTALAQGLRDRDRTFDASEQLAADLRKARLHWGPLYLLSYLEFSDLGYDQTYFVPTSDQAGGFSLAVAAPQRLYFVPTRKSVFSIEATPELAFFRSRSNNTQLGYTLRADSHLFFTHLYVDGYALTSNRLQALIGEINRIATQRQQGVGVTGEARYSSRTRLMYTANVQKISFPGARYQPVDVSVALLDRTEHNYRLSLRHWTFPLTRLTLSAERSDYSFDNAPQKDSHRTFFGPGAMYDDGLTTANIEVGPAKLTYKQPGQKEFSGIVGNFSLGHRLSPRSTLSAAASRDAAISIFLANNYYVADRLHVGGDYQATRRLSLLAGSTWGRDDYAVPVTVAGIGTVRRRDTFSFTSVGWRYSLRHVRGGFDIGYYDRTSNVDIDQQNGIRLIIQLSFSP